MTAYCTLLACFARCSVREQDAAFVYHNGIHVSERQHVEKLSGVNAGAIVEERNESRTTGPRTALLEGNGCYDFAGETWAV